MTKKGFNVGRGGEQKFYVFFTQNAYLVKTMCNILSLCVYECLVFIPDLGEEKIQIWL